MQPHRAWIERLRQELRHHFAHRIPPYVPPSKLTDIDQVEYDRLDEEVSIAFQNGSPEEVLEIQKKMIVLGTFAPEIHLFEKGGWMPLNPTTFNDVVRFQIVGMEMFEILRPKLKMR